MSLLRDLDFAKAMSNLSPAAILLGTTLNILEAGKWLGLHNNHSLTVCSIDRSSLVPSQGGTGRTFQFAKSEHVFISHEVRFIDARDDGCS